MKTLEEVVLGQLFCQKGLREYVDLRYQIAKKAIDGGGDWSAALRGIAHITAGCARACATIDTTTDHYNFIRDASAVATIVSACQTTKEQGFLAYTTIVIGVLSDKPATVPFVGRAIIDGLYRGEVANLDREHVGDTDIRYHNLIDVPLAIGNIPTDPLVTGSVSNSIQLILDSPRGQAVARQVVYACDDALPKAGDAPLVVHIMSDWLFKIFARGSLMQKVAAVRHMNCVKEAPGSRKICFQVPVSEAIPVRTPPTPESSRKKSDTVRIPLPPRPDSTHVVPAPKSV
jgi:hypothetical protein